MRATTMHCEPLKDILVRPPVRHQQRKPCASVLERLVRLDRHLFTRAGSGLVDGQQREIVPYNVQRVYLQIEIDHNYTVVMVSAAASGNVSVQQSLIYPDRRRVLTLNDDLVTVQCQQLIIADFALGSYQFMEVLYRG